MQNTVNSNYSQHVIHGEYYPHIDGIRALAILPVVLFHILASLCPGGFAGVDVFFVISGYLITGGILRDLKKGRFTIRNFYYRRIRRIMPAYFAMIAGVFAVGCVVYYATPLMLLGDAVAASTLFLANIHFFLIGGDYFAPQLHSQALLHLWSLSVEEQFYLFIPLLSVMLWKLGRRVLVSVFALLTILSMAAAIHAVMIGKLNAAFYVLPYRAWELLAGALLSAMPIVLPKKWNNQVAIIGLLMVLVTYAVISSKTPFPGAAALLPVFGTVILIRYGQGGWVSGVLSLRPLVLCGKISYSFYLWHWPVIVFWRYVTYDQLYFYDYLGMFMVSLILGYLSWRLVELPVRTLKSWTMPRSFSFAGVGIVVLVVLGATCVYHKGWPMFLHVKANELRNKEPPFRSEQHRILSWIDEMAETKGNHPLFRLARILVSLERRAVGLLGVTVNSTRGLYSTDADSTLGASEVSPQFLLIGDSHSGHLQYGLDILLRKKGCAGFSVIHSGTDMYNTDLQETQDALKKVEETPSIRCVVLAERWSSPRQLSNGRRFTQIEEFSLRVRAMKKSLFIISDNPNFTYTPCDIAARMKIIQPRHVYPEWKNCIQTEEEYTRMQGEINSELDAICKRTGAVRIPLQMAFKQPEGYISFVMKDNGSVQLYTDDNHLSSEGSLRAAEFIIPYLFPENTQKK